MNIRALLTALCIVVLAGCASVNADYHRPAAALIDVPTAQGTLAPTDDALYTVQPPPAQWWRLYRDPVLDALIEQALQANTDLRVARANIARAQAGLEIAEDAARPQTNLQAGAAYERLSAEEELHPGKPFPNERVYTMSAAVSYQLDLFGQIDASIKASQTDVAAAQAAFDATRITIVAETTRAYLDACSASREIGVAERQVDLQRQSTELTQKLFSTGRGISLDVTRSATQQDQVAATLPPLRAQRELALFRLATLIGRPPSETSPAASACTHEPKLTQPIPLGDGAQLLARRPDVRRAEQELKAATLRIGVAKGDLYPKIVFGASVGSTGLQDNFLKNDTFKFFLGPLLSWQFPNRARVYASIHGAEAQADAAFARFDGTVLGALRETYSALAVYSHDLERQRLLESARDKALIAAKDSESLYAAGRQGYFPVLDANRVLIQTEQSLASSESRVASDQVQLFLALGGGWESDADNGTRKASTSQ
jgi:multidrug efflux system outer membrane protein